MNNLIAWLSMFRKKPFNQYHLKLQKSNKITNMSEAQGVPVNIEVPSFARFYNLAQILI